MTRLPRQLLARAWKENRLLPSLLQTCRDLNSARRELEWLKSHAVETARKPVHEAQIPWRPLLKKLCYERARGKPLQYLLGSEFFGELEITCRPGVLIPRQETAATISHLVGLFCHAQEPGFPDALKVLDLCTGTGCIPLLFAHLFPLNQIWELHVLGVDICPKSVALAKYNHATIFQQTTDQTPWTNDLDVPSLYRRSQHSTSRYINFIQADVLAGSSARRNTDPLDLRSVLHREGQPHWDILISNPPYISPKAFISSTTRSVRNYEPKLALVPGTQDLELQDEEQGDLFYPRLLQIAEEVEAKIWLVEVADLAQAERVAAIAQSSGKWDGVEIWRDEPGLNSFGLQESVVEGVQIAGEGHGRSVLCWRGPAGSWLGREITVA